LLNEERSAFWKFFLTYFISVALLILSLGYFYFLQTSTALLKFEHFSLIEYAKEIKMGESHKNTQDISYEVVQKNIDNFSIRNFSHNGTLFTKFIPHNQKNLYLKISKSDTAYNRKVKSLQIKIILAQLALLLFFASISWFLAHKALKPLQRSINLLDSFSKDLIHDLNTPATSIRLNIELLKTTPNINQKILTRLVKSSDQISSLHTNLTSLLQNRVFIATNVNVSRCIEDILSTYETLYPHIKVKHHIRRLKVDINEEAFRQILSNLISNAFKYNKRDGFVEVISENSTLIIRDGGVGIKDTTKIFTRGYKENENGIGIGLDITKRLCDALQIEIDVISDPEGTTFTLHFN
jgi:two-component system, OmpR family, sensor kinase